MNKVYEEPIVEVIDIEDVVTDELELPDDGSGNIGGGGGGIL